MSVTAEVIWAHDAGNGEQDGLHLKQAATIGDWYRIQATDIDPRGSQQTGADRRKRVSQGWRSYCHGCVRVYVGF